MITITKTFRWSPDGMRVETIAAGDYESLPARAIELANQIHAIAKPVRAAKGKRDADSRRD